MKKRNLKLILFFFIYSFFFVLTSSAQSDSIMIFNFERDSEMEAGWIQTNDADYKVAKSGNESIVKVKTVNTVLRPGVTLYRTEKNDFDLTGFYQVKSDVSNLSSNEIQVELFVGNDPDGLVRWFCSDYVDLKPGESKTITVNLAWTPWVHKPQPEVVAMRGIPGKIKTPQKDIAQFQFNTRYAESPSAFAIHNIRAVGKLVEKSPDGFFPFVDEFGQYKHSDWKDKIHSVADLKKQNEKELEELKRYPSPENRGTYGGWTAGPKLEATGFFRTEKYNDKWWMVDPEGYLFWTAGLNCVSSNTGTTGVEYREKYFENLPDRNGEFKQFYGKNQWSPMGFYNDKAPFDTYNFLASNLYKKYGNDWLETFRERIHLRLRSWGLNTIGFVSDFGAALQHKTPYVGSIWIRNTPKIEGSGGYWGKFHDVFDPEFRKIVKRSVKQQQTGANDSWCIGFFVDNELSWGTKGSLSVGTLESPADQPAKIEFINDLKQKYQSIEKLNKQWKTNHSSWNDLLESKVAPDQKYAQEDIDIFYEKIVDTYFKTINEELKKVAPNQNYLGCRFAWNNNDITLRTASKYCDIISFNKYEFSVEKVGLPKGVDHPIMIGEFHFGSTDRGLTHPGVKVVNTQAERGEAYKSYIQGALRNKLIVGAHWFQFTDQPLTGRGDGENYNVGFIDACDTPFEELIEKVRETCYEMYEYRLKN